MILGLLAMVGGAVQGFNLLLVLSSTLLAAMIVHWRWSGRSIETVGVERRLPNEVFAGKPFRVRYQTSNSNWLMPAWLLQISDDVTAVYDNGVQAEAKCGLGTLPAKVTIGASVDLTIRKRGQYRFGPLTASTTFPFSLIHARKTETSTDTLDVYPNLVQLPVGWKHRLLSHQGGTATAVNRSAPSEGEFFAMREYQYGDNPKWIHWRTTARVGSPTIRQFEHLEKYDLCLVLDAFEPGQSGDYISDALMDPTEYAISYLTTMLTELIQIPGNRIVLAIAGAEIQTMQTGNDPQTFRRMMGALARAQSTTSSTVGLAVERVVDEIQSINDIVVVSCRSEREGFDAEPGLQNALSPWTRRGRFQWIQAEVSEAVVTS